jgi:hypothetical protein
MSMWVSECYSLPILAGRKSMGRRRKKKGQTLVARDVATGKVVADVEELFRLIHQNNPTDRGLSQGETETRYATKSKLQSRLLRDHFDKLRIVPEQQGELIAIDHRYGPGNACHALVSELDDDVRAKVRRFLDEEAQWSPDEEVLLPLQPLPTAVDGEPPAADLAGLTEAELVREGKQALDSWDYDRAKAAFALATTSSGGLEAARCLLELLVNHLGLDEEALAFEGRLSPSVLGDQVVREMLAVAAARCRLVAKAAALMNGVRTAPSAEAAVILAEVSLQEGDEPGYTRWLELARQGGAPPHDLARLEAALAHHRDARRSPREAQLEEMWQLGDLEQSRRYAQDLIGDYPESAVAHRVLRELQARDDQRRLGELLVQFEKAMTAGRTGPALNYLRDAILLGGDGADQLRQRLSELERLERERRRERQLAQAIQLVEAGDLVKALPAYVELDREHRALVREARDLPLFRWLDEWGAQQAKAKARESIVDALLALHRAQHAVEEGKAAEAESLLALHERSLRRLKVFKEVRAAAQEALSRQVAAEQRTLLDEAEEEAKEGNIQAARATLARLDVKTLPPAHRQRLAETEELIRFGEEIETLTQQVELCQAGDELFEGRALAGKLALLTTGAEKAKWSAKSQDYGRRLKLDWRMQRDPTEGSRVLNGFQIRPVDALAPFQLTADGQQLIVATARADWLFIWLIDVDSSQIKERISLKTPGPLGDFVDTIADGTTVWFIGHTGNMLEMTLDDWDILSWRPLSKLMKTEERLENVCYLPGSRYLWLTTSTRGGALGCHVIDLDRWRVHRTFDDVGMAYPVITDAEPLVFVEDCNEEHALFDARGTLHRDLVVPGNPAIDTAVPHPSGNGLLFLNRFHDYDGDEAYELTVNAFLPDGTTTDEVPFENSEPDLIHATATSLEQQLSFVMFRNSDQGCELASVSPTVSGLEISDRKPAGSATALIQDARSRHVVALSKDENNRIHVSRLGRHLPDTSAHHDLPKGPLPSFGGLYLCHHQYVAGSDSAKAPTSTLWHLPRERRPGWLQSYLRDHEADPEAVAKVLQSLSSRIVDEDTEKLLGLLDQAQSGHPLVLMFRAEHAVEKHEWAQARCLLSRVKPDALEESAAQHYYHLLGMTLLCQGEGKGALRAWEQGRKLDGKCRLEPYIDLVAELPQGGALENLGPDDSLARRLRLSVEAYDKAMAAGDGRAALRAIDQPWVWEALEQQSLARLATAFLDDQVSSPSGLFCKRLALASFIQARQGDYREGRELPLATGRWSGPELDRVMETVQDAIPHL